ncbi:MAG: hypothetical protein P8K10_01525 [Crocinitomicaceae bacterium]|nr:hypothetical protein [Crocinitomicaceae bacterium]
MKLRLKKLFPGILLLFIISCSTETDRESSKVNTSNEPSEENIDSEIGDTLKQFKIASNGLEYKVIQEYENKYASGKLTSVIDGNVYNLDAKKSSVFLESRLSTKNHSLAFFEDKHPTFLSSEMNNVLNPDTLLLINTKVNSEIFESIQADRFFKDSSFVNSGDLLLILSNTFHSHDAYFIHVWEISRGNGTYVQQRKTYKFNAEHVLIDESFMNHSFSSSSKARNFIEFLF